MSDALKDTEQDGLWEASETPDLTRLLNEFQRSGGTSNVQYRIEVNDRIRYCLWPGRSSDYKKWKKLLGKEPVPYDGAWDGRIPVADDIIEDLADVLGQAFRRAKLQAVPTNAQSIGNAANMTKVLNKYKDRTKKELNEEADFMADFGLAYGNGVWQTGWERELHMKETPLKLADIEGAAQQMHSAAAQAQDRAQIEALFQQADYLLSLVQILRDPTQEGPAIEIVQTFARQLAQQAALSRDAATGYGSDWLPHYELSTREARTIVRELRAQGESGIPTPYPHKNGPFAVARQVGVDIVVPPETTDIRKAPWITIREWLTPVQLRENQVTDGWRKDWSSAAIKTAGTTSTWTDELQSDRDFVSDEGGETGEWQAANTKSGLVEVLHTFTLCVTRSGVLEIWCTVWCPHVSQDETGNKDLYATHYPANFPHGEYPVTEWRRRKKKRNFYANVGIPEQIGSDQQQIKRTLDQLEDRKDLEVNPPVLTRNRLGQRYKAGPGSQIPFKRREDLDFAPPPTGNPEIAFALIEYTMKRLSNKYGLMNEHVLPAKWQMKLQALVERYLDSAGDMFQQWSALIQENADQAEMERIAGDDVNFPRTPEEIQGEFDVNLVFDARDLDMEFVWKKVEAVLKWAVPLDRSGRLKSGMLVEFVMRAIDPSWANALVGDENSATQAMWKEVQQAVVGMYVGMEPDYVENDPSAPQKLQFLRQILYGDDQGQGANPELLEAMGALPNADPSKVKPRFAELMARFQENLQMSVKQQQNITTGIYGTKVEGPQ